MKDFKTIKDKIISRIKYLGLLFSSRKKYNDREATIKEYLERVDPEDVSEDIDYEKLYKLALEDVGKQDFKEDTKESVNYFHELTGDESLIAVLVGIVAYGAAYEVDKNGSDIEAAIDKVLPQDYDVNNPFDSERGYGHRIFGHDIWTFALKNIPGDLHVTVNKGDGMETLMLAELLDGDIEAKYSMLDLIWKFYGNNKKLKGIKDCLIHTIVHFAKDIFTPSGLPLPFVTLANQYKHYEDYDGSWIKYKDSLMQKLDNLRLNMKASDFASFMFIELFIEFYCRVKKIDEDVVGFKHDMKLIAMGTCLSFQMASILIGEEMQIGKRGNKKMIPGGKFNLLLTGAFLKISVQEMISVCNARNEINKQYDRIIEG